ncbi:MULTISPECIES: cyclase family protein [Cellulomonas]|uniref:cyclase family protein n=1 Tax=Cellulomonas TaxID=1707 RepID=UPI000626B4D9|nr:MULTISPECIES: cyclase family protein [Cellulomonas]
MVTLPSYDDLPEGPAGGRLAWHVFGADDQLGLLNLLTPERVREAAALVRRGATFPLDHPLDRYRPPLHPDRAVPEHHVTTALSGLLLDDAYDRFHPQAGSQWDALAHVGYDAGVFYNGATLAQVTSGTRNTVDRWARHGVVGRAVVLDMPATFAAAGVDHDPSSTLRYGVEELRAAAEHGGVTHRPGDVLLLHTGFGEWYAAQDAATRERLPGAVTTPGLAQTEDVARYLWDLHAVGVASDNYAVEAWPPPAGGVPEPFRFLHRTLIGSFGMLLGELWHLADLVADCRADGRHEGMLTSAPLHAPGGVGSTANALVLK